MGSLFQSIADAAPSGWFERELEFVKAKTFDIKYPLLMARELIPVSNEAPAGARSVTYQQFQNRNNAKLMGTHGASPRIDVDGVEFERPVRTARASYGWDVIEVKEAAMTGRRLDQKKSKAARRTVEEVLDEVAAVGDADNGIVSGALNDPNVAITASAGGVWSGLTGDAIIANVSTLYQNIINNSLGIHRPTHLVLPTEQHALINTTPRSASTDTTILEFIENKFKIKVVMWYRLDLAGAGGAIDRAWMYERNDENLLQDISNEFEQLPVQEKGMECVVETFARTAGTQIAFPLAHEYMDTI